MWQVLVVILSSKCAVCLSPEIVDLLTPMHEIGEACGYESCPTTRPGVLNVHIVPHTHYELGYSRTFHEHYSGSDRQFASTDINMKRTLDFVITELWAHRHRKFTLSDFPYFFQWWSKRDPAVRRMVYELLRQGRLYFVGGGWSMNDEATTSYHAIIESFTYSLRKLNATFLECGRPLVAWQADVMGHSREFASLAALMGFDALFVSPISFDDELARMSRWALEMLWRGSDELGPVSDIFTHKLFDGFWAPPGFCFSRRCTDPLIVTSDNTFNNAAERGLAFIDSMLQRQAPNYNTSHVMVVMGGMFAYFDASTWFANIDKLIFQVNNLAVSKGRQMHLSYSTPACYLKAVHEANPPLETKQDDFYPMAYDKNSYLTGYYTSHPPIKLMAREGLVYLQMAKQMQVLARLFDNSQTFEAYNWILGAFQDHMIIAGAMKNYVKSYYVHKMYVAVQKSTLLLKQAWNKLRKCPKGTIYYRCSFNISSCHNARGRQTFIMIYNPLAWPVTLPVRLPMTLRGETRVYLPNGDQVKTAILKIAEPILNIKYRITHMATHEIVFMAENLPPLGFRSYFIEKVIFKRNKRTLIKNLKRKNNKKYLIRQTNPLIDDQILLNDLDYDYSDETSDDKMNGTKTEEEYADTLKSQLADDIIKESDFTPSKTVYKSKKDKNTSQHKDKTDITDDMVKEFEFTPSKTVYKSTIDNNTSKHKHTTDISDDINKKSDFIPYQTVYKSMIDKTASKRKHITDIADNINKETDFTQEKTVSKSIKENTSNNKHTIDIADDVIKKSDFTQSQTVSKSIKDASKHKNTIDIADDVIKESDFPPSMSINKSVKDSSPSKRKDVGTGDHLEMLDDARKQLWLEYESKTKKKNKLSSTTTTTDKVDVVISDDYDSIKLDDDDDEDTTVKDDYDVVIADDTEEDSTRSSTSPKYTLDIKMDDLSDKVTTSAWSNKETVTEAMTEEIETTTVTRTEDESLTKGRIEDESELKEGRRMMPKEEDLFIENKYIRINLDPSSRKISDVTLSNGLHIDLDIQFYFYISDDPHRLNKLKIIRPGPILFRPMDGKPVPILDYSTNKIYKSSIVEEVHYACADWASAVVRLYAGNAVIEVDWLVGPVPLNDRLGKEIFIRYTTDLVNEGVFYTDTNGRQTVKRIRNMRPMYESLNNDPVAGNFYPVTSKVYIEDSNKNLRFTVFNDRAQGGASLYDGEIDLLVQRRGLTDDTGIVAPLNDTEFDEGVIVRGKHYLYLSKADYKPNKIFEKKFAKELELQPQILVSAPNPYGNNSKELWFKHVNEFSFLKSKLPIGVHILTLEEWNDGTLLLRLENYLEKNDIKSNGVKRVFIRELFTNLVIKTAKETTLAANIWLDEFKQKRWTKKEDFVKNFNEFYGGKKEVEFLKNEGYNFNDLFDRVNLDQGVTLAPQQIRTFVCTYDNLMPY